MTNCDRCKRRLKAGDGDMTDTEKPLCMRCMKAEDRRNDWPEDKKKRYEEWIEEQVKIRETIEQEKREQFIELMEAQGHEVITNEDGSMNIKKKEAEA